MAPGGQDHYADICYDRGYGGYIRQRFQPLHGCSIKLSSDVKLCTIIFSFEALLAAATIDIEPHDSLACKRISFGAGCIGSVYELEEILRAEVTL
jgi:hypothetical protein